MSENPITITNLNDFIFCPVSIYFHALDADTDRMTYQSSYQLNGTEAHKKSDNKEYSTRADTLQSVEVYCGKYDLYGKIDIYHRETGKLVERKKKIKKVYDGYVFQIYAQYFALKEMGENVTSLNLYSMDDNKSYPVPLPEDDPIMLEKFEETVYNLQTFNPRNFRQENAEKCAMCIYNPLCSFACNREMKL